MKNGIKRVAYALLVIAVTVAFLLLCVLPGGIVTAILYVVGVSLPFAVAIGIVVELVVILGVISDIAAAKPSETQEKDDQGGVSAGSAGSTSEHAAEDGQAEERPVGKGGLLSHTDPKDRMGDCDSPPSWMSDQPEESSNGTGWFGDGGDNPSVPSAQEGEW